jgi:alpha,alpha-trehalase
MDRRSFISMAAASTVAMAAGIGRGEDTTAADSQIKYPEAWPPQQIIAAMALQRHGYQTQARDVSRRYIGNVVTTWEKTGLLWERYNGVDGGHLVPLERHEFRPLHGFTSASAVVVGRIAFN